MPVYMDHAATTPLRPEAREAWLRAAATLGNPASVHAAGQHARRLLEESRERLAVLMGCEPIEVVFTSGGTEAVNLAVKGLWWARPAGARTIVLPDGEHHATLDTAEWLAQAQGAHLAHVPLDAQARISHDAFAAACDQPDVALATALAANNEAGTLNDPAELSRLAASAGVPLHVDAIAAFGHVPVDLAGWRGDAVGAAGLVGMSVSAHKVGGPVGVGALAVSRHASPSALLHGGGQQRGLRSGTQDVAGAAAFAVAAECAVAEREVEADRLAGLRDRLIAGVLAAVPTARLLGDPVGRLPGNAHILFDDARGDTLLFLLDQEGIAVSTGSACQAGVAEPSHVVRALGHGDTAAQSVLRLTLGWTSTEADVEALLRAIPDAHERAAAAARRAGSAARS